MGKSKGKNFGSIRELPGGRFQARYTVDGVRYNGETTFADELDAYAYLAGVRKAIKSGEWEPPKPKEPEPQTPAIPTVGEMVRIWLEVAKPNVRNSTFKAY
ncbi:hypothetical protein [Corynebacterium sp. EPI-003-04-2554_SCH2473622]|uniref:hypothetical protein n=1 Tax=Corynebacterium sp. EPI-003-04-2554_SCH2473622 TaxID=1834153 RepID=UPI000AF48E17|nr:hypothetical protein [Corynebacterium sp. EPI-003-04-2554_SCH2473622]